MKTSTIFDLEAAIGLCAAGETEKAMSLLKSVHHEVTKRDYPWHGMEDHPEPNVPVGIIYCTPATDPSVYVGMWTGEKWLTRVPYSKDSFEEPKNITIIAWRDFVDKEEE